MQLLLRGILLACLLWAPVCGRADLRQSLVEAAQLETQGQFQKAAALLRTTLADRSLSPAQRAEAEFELDRLDRIEKDFPHTAEALFSALKKSVRDLTRAEFDAWVAEKRFDSRVIDGQTRYMVSSVSNLFFRYPELNPRRLPPLDNGPLERAHLATCLAIEKAAREEGQPYVLPKKFSATMTVKARPGNNLDGEPVRAWLPVPRAYPFQTGFTLLRSSPEMKHLDAEDSPIRSVLLEWNGAHSIAPDAAVEFRIDYEYATKGVSFQVDPSRVRAADTNNPALAPWVREAAHVVFTPQMRDLARTLSGTNTNPYFVARSFYRWIAENIKYSYAIEYSTIRNIGEYCRDRGYGDCGQEALLFITLCRLSGIPARWQSGWSTFPGAKTIHDWAEIYLEPYGWMPVDPYMGIYAMRYTTSLAAADQARLRDFYFGGLDQYRMIANSDHSRDLNPPKRALRSDTVDFQRGELEVGSRNLYFDRFSYDLEIREISPP